MDFFTTACARRTAPRSRCGRVRWWAFCQSSPQWSWTPRYGSDCVCFANGPSGTLSISCGRETISTTSPSAAGRSDLARREVPLPAPSGSYARRERVSIALRVEIALALPSGTPLGSRFRRSHLRARLRTGRVTLQPLRRQLQLPVTGLVPSELPRNRIAEAPSQLFRRGLDGRIADRIGQAAES
jgi:hypothetical protein